MNGTRKRWHFTITLFVALSLLVLSPGASYSASTLDVAISEIAWMGTTDSSDNEWIELYNNTGAAIDLSGWSLTAADGTPTIALTGSIPAGGHFLLERTDDDSVPGVAADQTYTGALGNDGEQLLLRDNLAILVDEVDCASGWYSGHNQARVPMVRVDTHVGGSLSGNWTYNPRCGTATNLHGDVHQCTLAVADVNGALNYSAYLNDLATTATETTLDHTEMEDALLALIDGAATSIDIALYGLDRQSVVNALIAAHSDGVTVRVVGDDAAAGEYSSGYQALSDAGITVVTDTSLSKIQHNKFLVVDGSIVWTGSTNFTDTGFTLNANNSIAITDTMMANIYATEFEEMWAGGFDGAKTDNTLHLLEYDNLKVESYFSPTDLPAFEVWDELADAEQTIHFAMFFWTDALLSNRVVERLADGVQVFGIFDQLGAANESSQDEMLCAAGARIGIEDLPGKVHHKFTVIDVAGDDPVVILGSYNWTESGAYDNDENTLIVHDRDLAELYFAEWQRLWATVSLDRICNPATTYLPLALQSWPPTPTPSPTPTTRPTATPPPLPSPTPTQPPATTGNVQIVDIYYDGAGSQEPDEYVAIRNDDSQQIQLYNWTLRDVANHAFTFPQFTMVPGQTCRVYTNQSHPEWCGFNYGSGSAIWNNSGDTAYLRDSYGNPVDSYSY